MRNLLILIIVVVITIGVSMVVVRSGLNMSLSTTLQAQTANNIKAEPEPSFDVLSEHEEPVGPWIDTIMYAKGHAFGYVGDVSMWGGWYFDSICVGDDNMLRYDSIGPSKLKLSLVTKKLIIDMGDPNAIEKIKSFMNPIQGFSRFRKFYKEVLDSVDCKDFGYKQTTGSFTLIVDYPEVSNRNEEKISLFINELTESSECALHIEFSPTNYEKPIRIENMNDLRNMADYLADGIMENWKRTGEYGLGSNEVLLALKLHNINKEYVTFSKYEYLREGTGHGMYIETFHTFNLKSGKKLRNMTVFKSQDIDKVKMELFKVMAADPKYVSWHGGSVRPEEIEELIMAWQTLNSVFEGTEWEEPERRIKFELPDGALTDTGVIFSFQPYEIDCWAAGSYHFIVPYKKLMPYFSTEVKCLLKS